MSKTAVRVRSLGKLYRLGELQRRTFRETVSGLLRREMHKHDILWALKDVSFDVEQGEVVGIIGRNGAGKSTLLKVLSQITYPTEGYADVRGRVASLLEVGTGFHPELTGRENIFLNGAILGMTHREISRKFDEIVAFSGVEKFIDTPVKRYSSGMTVRLAFSVAAHLDAEVLLVDEVLAVGDVEFQRKCMGKMNDVVRGGRTVLFVSHNMAAVEGLCSRGVLLEQGQVARLGNVEDVIAAYLDSSGESAHTHEASDSERAIQKFTICDVSGKPVSSVSIGDDAVFEIEGHMPEALGTSTFNIRIDSLMGQRVTVFHTYYQYPEVLELAGAFALKCHFKNCRLMPGSYALSVIMKTERDYQEVVDGLRLEVIPRDVYGTGKMLPPQIGHYVPEAEWQIQTADRRPQTADFEKV